MSERVPRPDNFDPIEFAKSIEDSTPKNSRLLGQTALENAQNLSLRAKMLEDVTKVPVPQNILNDFKRSLNWYIDDYIAEDYNVEKEVREPLSEAPAFIKHRQNETFTRLATEDRNGTFITRIINPKKYERKRNVLDAIFSRGPTIYYDFIGKLTEKDDNGKYVIPDETVKNFVSWYHTKMANKEKQVSDVYDINYYKDSLHLAVQHDILPKAFEERVKLLNNDSEKSINVENGVLDAINAYKEGYDDFFVSGGECTGLLFSREKEIKLSINLLLLKESYGRLDLEYDALKTFYHELTHAISGDKINFGDNKRANKIFDEALTESISNLILEAMDFEDPEETIDDINPFGGVSYKLGRKVLEYLSSGGGKDINPTEFYAAYIETDKNYESIRDEDFFNLSFCKDYDDYDQLYDKIGDFEDNPYRTYGPNQQKLIDDLLESFPECKDLTGLGKMIVDKFNELKEGSKEDATPHASA